RRKKGGADRGRRRQKPHRNKIDRKKTEIAEPAPAPAGRKPAPRRAPFPQRKRREQRYRSAQTDGDFDLRRHAAFPPCPLITYCPRSGVAARHWPCYRSFTRALRVRGAVSRGGRGTDGRLHPATDQWHHVRLYL